MRISFFVLFLFGIASLWGAEDNTSRMPSVEIDPDKHVFGLPLGMADDEVVAKLGEPTGSIQMDDTQSALLYGPNCALLFAKGKLDGVWLGDHIICWQLSTQVDGPTWISQRQWRLSNGIRKDTTLKKVREIVGSELSGSDSHRKEYFTERSKVRISFSGNPDKSDSSFRVYSILIQGARSADSQRGLRIVDPDAHIFGIPFDTPEPEVIARLGKPQGRLCLSQGLTGLLYSNDCIILTKENLLVGVFLGSDAIAYSFPMDRSRQTDEKWSFTSGINPNSSLEEMRRILGDRLVAAEDPSQKYRQRYETEKTEVRFSLSHRTDKGNGDDAYHVNSVIVSKKELLPKELSRRIKMDPNDPKFGMGVVRGGSGCRVSSVAKGSPADKGGVLAGDLITELDGEDCTGLSAHELLAKFGEKKGFKFTLVSKEGVRRQVDLTKVRQGDFMNTDGCSTLASQLAGAAEAFLGKPAPDTLGKDLTGKELRVSDFRGKPLLVNFTATWCGPCKAELPELQEAYQKYHDKGIEFVSVFLDEDSKEVAERAQSQKILWPCIAGGGWDSPVGRAWGIHSVPTNVLIDRQGIVHTENVRADIDAALESCLSPTPTTTAP